MRVFIGLLFFKFFFPYAASEKFRLFRLAQVLDCEEASNSWEELMYG